MHVDNDTSTMGRVKDIIYKYCQMSSMKGVARSMKTSYMVWRVLWRVAAVTGEIMKCFLLDRCYLLV